MSNNKGIIRILLSAMLLVSLLLAACSSEAEPEAPTVTLAPPPVAEETATEETAAPEATATMEPLEPEPTAVPVQTETVDPLPTATTPIEATPTFVPQPTTATGGALPINEELSFTLTEQFGGVPHALAVEATTAYVGFGPRLLVLDVSDPANPQLLGQSQPLPDIIYGVAIVEGLAYLASGSGGLISLDIRDPANLTILSEGPNYPDASQTPPSAEAVTVVGNTAYVTDFNRMDGSIALLSIDVSDPAAPAPLERLELRAGERAMVGNGVVVIVGNGRLQLRDAADLTSILGETTLASGEYASHAVVYENSVIVAEAGEPSGIERFDISDPAAPLAVGALAPAEFFFANQLVTNGQTLFFDSTFGEFGHCGSEIRAIDLSADTPTSIHTFMPENCIRELALEGNTLYLAGSSGLHIYDVSDPASPVLSGQFRNPAGFHGVDSVVVRDEIGYVLAGEGRSFDIATLHLSRPDNPAGERVVVGTETLLDLFLTGDTLIAQVWMGGLNTLDVADPAAPVLLHQAVQGEIITGDYSAVAVGEGVVYTPIISDTLVGAVGAIDLSDPANPTIAGIVETGVPQVTSLALGDGMLYVMTQGEMVQIYYLDVSDPLQPALVGSVALPEFVGRLELVGDTLFAICDGHNCRNLYTINVSDPRGSVPPEPQQWALPVGVIGSESAGELIYLVTQEDGIWVLNAADPTNPYLAGQFELPNSFARLAVVGETIYAADFDAGLYVIEMTE